MCTFTIIWLSKSVQLEPDYTINLPETQPKKPKLDLRSENIRERMFNKDWEVLYFMSEQDGKPVCLLCFDTVSICKLYNVKCHYYSHHKDNDEKFPMA